MEDIQNTVYSLLEKAGFEAYAFKIGWYNECVMKNYILPYDYDTLAFIVISTPDMFDKAFKPFVCRQDCNGGRDLIDECMVDSFQKIKKNFPDEEIEIIHDFELHHTRRPKVLVQTAGHVAGAAYYYQASDVKNVPWDKSQKIFGVSVHPKYGGWFALRGVIIFKNVKCVNLEKKSPPDCVPTDELKIELLNRYNFQWQDWSFRDIVPSDKKYCEEQKKYFATLPKDRQELIEQIKNKGHIKVDDVTGLQK
ncbi:hypothetical protein SNE40_004315 [Patella caerulea]|uniref:Cyanocobalamin reductase (cyanide-eliminating) n=1 Tax=Patella caerulea TaxID=87958 RepID=A0AAN8Q5A0_PATCE